MKAQRAATDTALAALKAEQAKVVARQGEYDANLEDVTKKVAGALNGLGRKIDGATKSIDLTGHAEQAAARMDETYAKGDALAERHEKILSNIGLVVGYTGQWMLFAAVLVWGVGFLVWSLVRGWSMLVAESSGTWDKVQGFAGWAVFTAAVLAGLFFGGKWLYGKWRK
ncbi:hypothetical protein [Dermacoccus sp. UBA1591]|uniref:hypothetical protein n=1 Tax=Dermacoccus sp. UBA1591 TaxID=1946405 RepID=UPI002579D21D|nr:hypothetical protein [Dermacoccus sp. UBA1591]